MTDFSERPDAFIACEVAQAVGKKLWPHARICRLDETGCKLEDGSMFDPCNNPADAWPIIIENKISLIFDASTEEGNEVEWCLASSPCDQIIVDYVTPDKMIRAAMIVFLNMQEAKQ